VPGEVLICVFLGFWQTVVVGFTLVQEGLPEALVAMARARASEEHPGEERGRDQRHLEKPDSGHRHPPVVTPT
jgi:hypothetical protein